MSTDDRLARLGLSHLKDTPDEVAKALAHIVRREEALLEAWRMEQARRRAARQKGTAPGKPRPRR